MSNPVRTKQLRRTILETLSMAKGYAIEASTLRDYTNDLIRPPVEIMEWNEAINFLGINGHIALVPSDMDAGLKQWCITERGKTLLATQI